MGASITRMEGNSRVKILRAAFIGSWQVENGERGYDSDETQKGEKVQRAEGTKRSLHKREDEQLSLKVEY